MSDTFAVGDRVRVSNRTAGRFGQVGTLTAIDDQGPTLLYCNRVTFGDGRGGRYTADELERIDAEVAKHAATTVVDGTFAKPCGCEPGRCDGEDAGNSRCQYADRPDADWAHPLMPTTSQPPCAFTIGDRVRIVGKGPGVIVGRNEAYPGMFDVRPIESHALKVHSYTCSPANLELIEDLRVGDRVRVKACLSNYRHGEVATIVEVDEPGLLSSAITLEFPDREQMSDYLTRDLERIDEMDRDESTATMPTGVARSTHDDGSGAGSAAEHKETAHGSVPAGNPAPVGEDRRATDPTILELEARLRKLELLNKVQHEINRATVDSVVGIDRRMDRLDSPVTGEFVNLHAEQRTTRRMRVNITRNTKGYNFDTTFEMSSSDPDVSFTIEMTEGLRLADRLARQAIAEAEFNDQEGVPGADDTPY